MKKKRGVVFTVLATLILVVGGGLIAIGLFSAINSPIFFTISSMACHQNCAVRDILPFKVWLAPLPFCKLYEEPVEVDAMNFAACIELNTENLTNANKEEYYKQCARIQIDDLANSCWQMGGAGKYDLTPLHKKVVWGISAPNIANALTEAYEWSLATNAVTDSHYAAFTSIYKTKTGKDFDLYSPPKYLNTGVLRCFRFTIKQDDLFFEDGSLGRSQNYFEHNKLGGGGDGVTTAQPDEIGKTEMSDSTLILLNYKYDNKQICFISYYPDVDAVGRSCSRWTEGLDKYAFIN